MRALSACQLLDAWEQGKGKSLPERAILLLATACPEDSPGMLAEINIGARDRRLLRLRERVFGPRLTGLSDCPLCQTTLELAFGVSDVVSEPGDEPDGEMVVRTGGCEVSFRLPNSHDLQALTPGGSLAANRQLLLERCLTSVRFQDGDGNPNGLPGEVADAVVAKMARADSQADVQLDLRCPSCGYQWQAPFDILSYFWSEIDLWAREVIRQVHTLATAYGWSEASVLQMSAYRRRLYVEMIQE